MSCARRRAPAAPRGRPASLAPADDVTSADAPTALRAGRVGEGGEQRPPEPTGVSVTTVVRGGSRNAGDIIGLCAMRERRGSAARRMAIAITHACGPTPGRRGAATRR